MRKLTLNQETEIIACIDDLNQYINGNVTDDGILSVLHDTYISILKREITNTVKVDSIYEKY